MANKTKQNKYYACTMPTMPVLCLYYASTMPVLCLLCLYYAYYACTMPTMPIYNYPVIISIHRLHACSVLSTAKLIERIRFLLLTVTCLH